jgi:CRP-like cAMP-binding protein
MVQLALSASSLFSALSERVVSQLVGHMHKFDMHEGDTVMTQGEPGDFFYVVESGTYDVLVVDGAGHEQHVHAYRVSEGTKHPCFGELALMYAKPRAATVRCAGAGVLWGLDRPGFLSSMAHSRGPDVTALLRGVPELEALDFGRLQLLRDVLETLTTPAGQAVQTRGEQGETFHIVVRGHAEVQPVVSEEPVAGQEHEPTVLGEGDTFGNEGLDYEPRPASVTIVATTELVTLALSRATIERVLGPLQPLIEAAIAQREGEEASAREALERERLLGAGPADFAFEELLGHPDDSESWAVLRVTHKTTRREFTMRVASKAGLLDQHPEVAVAESVLLREALPACRLAWSEGGLLGLVFSTRLIGRLSVLAPLWRVDDGQARRGSVLAQERRQPRKSMASKAGTARGMEAGALLWCAASLIEALRALHEQHVLLRGVAAAWLDADGYVQLVDLHHSKRLDGEERTYTLLGSPGCFSPEMLKGCGHTLSADCWALGAVLHELATGRRPFGTPGGDEMAMLKAIRDFDPAVLHLPAHVEPRTAALIKGLLQPDPAQRLGAAGAGAVRQHEAVSGINWEAMAKGGVESPLRAKLEATRSNVRVDETGASSLVEALDVPISEGEDECFIGFAGTSAVQPAAAVVLDPGSASIPRGDAHHLNPTRGF